MQFLKRTFLRLGWLCFGLMWIPFAMVMIKGPLALVTTGGDIDVFQPFEIFSSNWLYALIALFAGAMIFLISYFVLTMVSLISGGVSHQSILKNGQDAEATILSMAETGTRINGHPLIEFSLQVNLESAPSFVTQVQKVVSFIELGAYQPNILLHVKVEPGTNEVAIVGLKM